MKKALARVFAVVCLFAIAAMLSPAIAQQVINGYRVLANIAAGSVPTPGSGFTAFYTDSTSKKLCTKDDAGTITCMGGGTVAYSNITPVSAGGSAVETDLQSVTLTTGDLVNGRVLHLNVWGILTTPGSGTGNGTWKLYYGSTVLVNSGAITLGTSKTNAGWHIQADITCPGSASATAACEIQGVANGLGGTPANLQDLSTSATVSLDTTATNPVVKVTVTPSTTVNTLTSRSMNAVRTP
jgi:hypothetical protein